MIIFPCQNLWYESMVKYLLLVQTTMISQSHRSDGVSFDMAGWIRKNVKRSPRILYQLRQIPRLFNDSVSTVNVIQSRTIQEGYNINDNYVKMEWKEVVEYFKVLSQKSSAEAEKCTKKSVSEKSVNGRDLTPAPSENKLVTIELCRVLIMSKNSTNLSSLQLTRVIA
jgi:hypothetical protein